MDGRSNSLSWRALILPQLEQNPLFNAINMNTTARGSATTDPGSGYTIWTTAITSFLCPSDPGSTGGFRPFYTTDPARGNGGVGIPPVNPATGQPATVVPIANYAGSFGDNHCIGSLTKTPANPWETPGNVEPLPGRPRIGHTGYWGTVNNWANGGRRDGGGTLRGIFDYRTGQITGINHITDGTSNTILVGEVLPEETADVNFWMLNGGTAGTTVPINLKTGRYPCLAGPQPRPFGSSDWGCRYSYASKGFKSKHPGGANMAFSDGSVKFLKATINLATYCALGSKNGGEVVSADAF